MLVASLIAAVLAAVLLRRRNTVYRRLYEAENTDADNDGIPDVHQHDTAAEGTTARPGPVADSLLTLLPAGLAMAVGSPARSANTGVRPRRDSLAIYAAPPIPGLAYMAVPSLTLPPRPRSTGCERPSKELQTAVPGHAATLGKN